MALIHECECETCKARQEAKQKLLDQLLELHDDLVFYMTEDPAAGTYYAVGVLEGILGLGDKP